MSASRSETTDAAGPDEPGSDLLAALLNGMDAALCAFDAGGVVTHWNREAERILGWTAAEAVGRHGFAGWAARSADADEVLARLMASMDDEGRHVHEFALLRKDGGRVLLRTQSAGVRGADGKPAGVYCAFSEVHAQIDLERSIALSEALLADASWGVVLVDVDLRPTVINAHAARALGSGRTTVLGRPLGELVVQGAEDLEEALHHVLSEGAPTGLVELWVTVRTAEGERRRCWRSGFLRLASPLAEEPVPLGVGWLFTDVTDARIAAREADKLRFQSNQLHRAARSAAECEDPMEAATTYLDFALAGFADHALIDLVAEPSGRGARPGAGAGSGGAGGGGAYDTYGSTDPDVPVRLVRAAATPTGGTGPVARVAGGNIPVRYLDGHPALRAMERVGSVRASAPAPARTPPGGSQQQPSAQQSPAAASPLPAPPTWAAARQWPSDTVHALCTVLRSRGRSLGVVTFLRTGGRPAFERPDAVYAEDVTVRMAAALDLARTLRTEP